MAFVKTGSLGTQKTAVIGHRGARGLQPENSLQGFAEAVDLGADGLEMDLLISADGKVVVTHDPVISPKICQNAEGKNLTEEETESLIIYNLPYAKIRSFDCGSKPHTDFPQQQNKPTHIPLLREVLEKVGSKTRNGEPLLFVLELKSDPETDGIHHPKPWDFVEKILNEVNRLGLQKQVLLISFDKRIISETKKQDDSLQVGYLFKHKETFKKDLSEMAIIPEFLCPHYSLLDKELLKYAEEKKIKLIPWTVNEPEDLESCLKLGLHGIITDYPDRLLFLLHERK